MAPRDNTQDLLRGAVAVGCSASEPSPGSGVPRDAGAGPGRVGAVPVGGLGGAREPRDGRRALRLLCQRTRVHGVCPLSRL